MGAIPYENMGCDILENTRMTHACNCSTPDAILYRGVGRGVQRVQTNLPFKPGFNDS